MQMLRDLIAKEQSTNVVKLSILCLIKIKDIYPSLAKQNSLILKELIVSQQDLLKK